MKHINFQYNDGGRSEHFKANNVGDCVTRAIAIGLSLPYKEVYDDLNSLAKSSKIGGSSREGHFKKTYHKYLLSKGWKWTPLMKIGSGCTVHLAADELPDGILICSLSKHIATVIDGTLHDIFDCSRNGTRCVYGYYSK